MGELSNEAQTRFSFIDRFLRDCLGWSDAGAIKVEVYEHRDRTDYECGQPRQLIVEAKKASAPFKFPPRGARGSQRYRLRAISDFDVELRAALSQAQTYCQARGVQLAAVANGPQLVIFLATRFDGIAPEDGEALVFTSYEELVKGFNVIYEALSPEGVDEKRVVAILSSTSPAGLPQKLSAACLNYFQYKYSSDFQESLRNAASLVVEDLGRTPSLEDDFLRECYCDSGPLSQFALLGKNLLAARYSALFSSSDTASRIEEVNPRKTRRAEFSQQALAEALARRPIVLIGDVGVGKSSFIKHLLRVRAIREFQASICIYFDLGSRGVLANSPRDALLAEIERTLRTEYKVNLQDATLVEAIYQEPLRDFDNGILSSLRDTDIVEWKRRRLNYIAQLLDQREEHLRRAIEYFGTQSRKQVIIVIDNADQRNIQVQQEAFLISQELASHWSSTVFLTLRPQTFHASKRSGTISAYPPKVFVVPPPKLEDVIERRLLFALKIAEGKLPVQGIAGLTLFVDSLAILISVLHRSLARNRELYEFIVNVSAGNVRVAIELISKFFGSPNVESEKIVKFHKENLEYVIPLHEFAKVALLGDYAHFQEDSSVASNVFAVVFPDKREHFLSLYILGYLAWEGAEKEHREGFVVRNALVTELQACAYSLDQINAHLSRLTRKRLIETSERRLLETAEDINELGMPEAFRITTLGAYHLKRWASEFSFLEAMSFDTQIFDQDVRNTLIPDVNDNRLSARNQRAERFVEYLDEVWKECVIRPYFDWHTLRAASQISFDRVRRRLLDIGLA